LLVGAWFFFDIGGGDFVPEVEEEDALHTVCDFPDDIAPIEDAALRFAILDAIEAETGVVYEDVFCGPLSELTRLEAGDLAIANLSGLEYAQSLTHLDLSNNVLVDTDALRAIFTLIYLNLHNANIERLETGSSITVQELYLGENSIRDISFLREYSAVTLLALQHNKIVSLDPLKELAALHAGNGAVFVYGNPLDLSTDSEETATINALKQAPVDVAWDQLTHSFHVTGRQNVEVSAPASITLAEDPFIKDHDPRQKISAVEFFEVHDQGMKVSIGMDEEAPFRMTISYENNEDDVGLHRYAAEIYSGDGAHSMTVEAQYVFVNVLEKLPECLNNVDCQDRNQCTSDSCVEGECVFQEIDGCAQSEISCTDGIDNDTDGEPDCDDSECFTHEACAYDPEPEPPAAVSCLPMVFSCGSEDKNGDYSCSLQAEGPKCNGTVFRCSTSTGKCKQGSREVTVGCGLKGLMSPNSSISVDTGDFSCGDIYMCSRIVLCAK